jgi:capsular polysaccharide biosynthesis protein
MELRTYAKILLRRWWLAVAPVIVVVIYVLATMAPPAASYQVVMRYAAGSMPSGTSLDYDRYYPWLTSEYIANGLADIAETGVFARAVADRLGRAGVDTSAGAVRSAIVTDNAQSILVVYITWTDPQQLLALAEAVSEELTQNGSDYFPQLEGIEPAIRLLDPPTPAPLPASLRAQLTGPAIRIAVALLAGVGLAFLWHYLDPTVHEVEELEEMGWEVLASIPRR